MMIPIVLFSGAVFLFFMPSNSIDESSNSWNLSHRIHRVEVVAEFPHDPDAFTQGLLYAGDDTLFESTGLYGKSSVRKVDLRTGKIEVLQQMDGSYFGEGLTLLGEKWGFKFISIFQIFIVYKFFSLSGCKVLSILYLSYAVFGIISFSFWTE